MPAAATAAEVDLCWGELGLGAGDRVLDVPCGDGRHAIGLARRGAEVTGVDLAVESIDRARAAAGALTVALVRADMRELPWTAWFHGAICLGNSLGYLDHAGTTEFLAALARSLRPGGRLVLQTGMIAERGLPVGGAERAFEAGGIRMEARSRYDEPAGRLVTRYRFIRDAVVEESTLSQAVFTVAGLERMLAAAGLVPVAAYADADRRPFVAGDHRIIIVAERRDVDSAAARSTPG